MTLLCSLHRPSPEAELYEVEKTVFDKTGKVIPISDYHNFTETPYDLEAILASLPKVGFQKIATFANSTIDALRMLDFVQSHPGVIGLSMGELGEITRILAPVVGCPLMYAPEHEEDATAPGQLTLKTLLETYHFRKLKRGTPIFGLIGDPVTHSVGYLFHNAHFQGNGVYVKMRIKSEELADFFFYARRLPFKGLSVTTPHKKKVIPFLDRLDPEAEAIGAVNTIVFHNGQLIGHNTDGKGALDALGEVSGKKIAVLGGRGGAGSAIVYVAKKRGADVVIVQRGGAVPEHDILINATGADDPAESTPNKIVLEVSTRETMFLKKARAQECLAIPGSAMFTRQAEYQLGLWESTRFLKAAIKLEK
jgi:3-dehydroquinate dehydratase/shikimate dehydrogenase